MNTIIEVGPRQTVVAAILVLFLGKYVTSKIAFLREYNIPEPVSGGLIASLLSGLAYAVFSLELQFALGLRDVLLISFFTTIGLSSKFSTLIEGGKALVVLLIAAVSYLFLQNFTGLAAAKVSGLRDEIGLIGGSVSLSGGHGTAIAWAPRFVEEYGVANAMELGVACATFGLILGGLIGGLPVESCSRDRGADAGIRFGRSDGAYGGTHFNTVEFGPKSRAFQRHSGSTTGRARSQT